MGLAAKSYAMPALEPGAKNQSIPSVATISKQMKTEWCWAAVITSIVATRRPPPSGYSEQCRLAFEVLQHSYNGLSLAECCDVTSPVGNTPIAPAWMNGEYPDIPSPLSVAGLAATPPQYTKYPIASSAVLAALEAGKAVCVGIRWSTGKSHFIAIVGARMDGGEQQFQVGDPTHGSVYWLSYADIETYHTEHSTGVWAYTYVTV
jgi:hypothetical protein